MPKPARIKPLAHRLPLAIALGLLWGCAPPQRPEGPPDPPAPPPVSLVRIASPASGTLVPQGAPVRVELLLAADTMPPDSLVLFIDNARVGRLDGLAHTLDTHGLRLGTRSLRITAWRGGQQQSVSAGIQVAASAPPKILSYRVVRSFPHDPRAFTQGLFYLNGYLIESTGLYGQSSLRRVELQTGRVIQSVNLDRVYFGEGAALHNGQIYQLTWTNRRGFVYDLETFERVRTISYPTDGWGITNLHGRLVMSDGSHNLYIMDPGPFVEVGRLEVMDHRGPVTRLNELEYIEGRIWANIFKTYWIAIIHPETGAVEAKVDFTGLLAPEHRHPEVDVLNGIAWDPRARRLFVTGKNWPLLFEVEVVGSGL